MVDIETYKQMHPESINSREESDVINVDDEKLPEGNFLYVLPSTIRGYGFHDKKWSKHRTNSGHRRGAHKPSQAAYRSK